MLETKDGWKSFTVTIPDEERAAELVTNLNTYLAMSYDEFHQLRKEHEREIRRDEFDIGKLLRRNDEIAELYKQFDKKFWQPVRERKIKVEEAKVRGIMKKRFEDRYEEHEGMGEWIIAKEYVSTSPWKGYVIRTMVVGIEYMKSVPRMGTVNKVIGCIGVDDMQYPNLYAELESKLQKRQLY